MKDSYLIGFTGRAGHGKDLSASILADIIKAGGGTVYSGALALLLKEEYARENNVPMSTLMGEDGREAKEAHRPGMQAKGDQRKDPEQGGYPMYWVDQLQKELEKPNIFTNADGHPKVVMVTDIRYDFEAGWARSYVPSYVPLPMLHAGLVIHIEGKNVKNPTIHSSHSSEAGVSHDYVDYVVNNDHSLPKEHLRQKLTDLWMKILVNH